MMKLGLYVSYELSCSGTVIGICSWDLACPWSGPGQYRYGAINTPSQDLFQGLLVEESRGIWLVGVEAADILMMTGWVMFGNIITQHKLSRKPCDINDFVVLLVTSPEVSCIHCTGPLLFNCAADNTGCS